MEEWDEGGDGGISEDQLLQSIMHNVLQGSCQPIRGYDPSVDMVSPFLNIPSVNPEQGCIEDGLNLFGPDLQAYTSISNKVISKGVECGEPVSSGLEYSLGSKFFWIRLDHFLRLKRLVRQMIGMRVEAIWTRLQELIRIREFHRAQILSQLERFLKCLFLSQSICL